MPLIFKVFNTNFIVNNFIAKIVIIKNLLIIILCCVLVSCTSTEHINPHIVLQTQAGDIEVELFPAQAPKTVAAILANIDSGVYKNAFFYRVLNESNQPSNAFKAELIQGGIWRTKGKRSLNLPRIPHETTHQTGLSHNDGTISMARQEPGSATTEFFICIGNQPGFDFGGENNPDGQGYAAFGRVVKGMKVVNIIYRRPEDDEYFDPPIAIYNITRL